MARPPRSTSSSIDGAWVVEALLDRQGRSAVPDGGVARMRLHLTTTMPRPRGRAGWLSVIGGLDAHDGHNQIGATFVRWRTWFRVLPWTTATTLLPDTTPLDQRLLDVRRLARDGDTLVCLGAGRQVVAVLGRSSGDDGRSPGD